MANIAEIYAFAASCGRPCQLPEPWSALSPPASFIHPPLDAAGLLDQLQSRFCDAELREAGLVATDPEGMTVLRPPWGDPTAVLFVARQAAEAAPFALVSDELDERHWPLPALFGDYQAPILAEKFNNCWFIVPTMADAAVIWSLGFPAAPAHGLADLKRARLAHFREAMELEREHEEDEPEREHEADEPNWSRQPLERQLPADADQETRSLVLVPWSPARLDAADASQIEAVGRHLLKLYRRLPVSLPIYIWKLGEKQLDALRFDASHFEPEDIRRAALDCFERTCREFSEPRPPRRPPKEHNDAVREWLELTRDPAANAERREQSWRQLCESQERDMIDPILEQAAAATDAAHRGLLMQYAALLRAARLETFNMISRSEQAMRGRRYQPGPPLPREDGLQVLAMTDRLTALFRELKAMSNETVGSAAPQLRRAAG